jgi:hypothetical protein
MFLLAQCARLKENTVCGTILIHKSKKVLTNILTAPTSQVGLNLSGQGRRNYLTKHEVLHLLTNWGSYRGDIKGPNSRGSFVDFSPSLRLPFSGITLTLGPRSTTLGSAVQSTEVFPFFNGYGLEKPLLSFGHVEQHTPYKADDHYTIYCSKTQLILRFISVPRIVGKFAFGQCRCRRSRTVSGSSQAELYTVCSGKQVLE